MKLGRYSKEPWQDTGLLLRGAKFSASERTWILDELESRILEGNLPKEESQRWIEDLCDRAAKGEPLQYLLGRWGFRALELIVDPRVLIPRPETELIVDVIGEILSKNSVQRSSTEDEVIVVEVGVGSGAIALSVASEFDFVKVYGTEVSSEALEVAAANLRKISRDLDESLLNHVEFLLGSFFDPLPTFLRDRVGVVVSNPPYLSEELYRCAPETVRNYEPKIALTPGQSGLEAIEVIVRESTRWLFPGGALVVEISPEQEQATRSLFDKWGFLEVDVLLDLAGRQRFVKGVRHGVRFHPNC